MTERPGPTKSQRTTAILLVLACVGGASYFLFKDSLGREASTARSAHTPQRPVETPGKPVEIGLACGSEKTRWLKWGVEEFSRTDEGRNVKVDLIPLGSVAAAKAIISGDRRIHVWSPASSLCRDVFVKEWSLRNGKSPIVKEKSLALTPMAYVMWEERYEAFIKKFGSLSFGAIAKALKEKGGWETIAGKPEWGLFKFGRTDPKSSNSGLMALILTAYDFHNKCGDLTLGDVMDVGFRNWLDEFEREAVGRARGTGVLMKEMALKGPSIYDAVIVYESVAIDFLKNAEGRWGRLRIVYPEKNELNENPYYILDVPWSSEAQRKAAEQLMEFLLSDRIQTNALIHGFRPANPAAPLKFRESPFVRYDKYGLKAELTTVCQTPEAEVVSFLLSDRPESRR